MAGDAKIIADLTCESLLPDGDVDVVAAALHDALEAERLDEAAHDVDRDAPAPGAASSSHEGADPHVAVGEVAEVAISPDGADGVLAKAWWADLVEDPGQMHVPLSLTPPPLPGMGASRNCSRPPVADWRLSDCSENQLTGWHQMVVEHLMAPDASWPQTGPLGITQMLQVAPGGPMLWYSILACMVCVGKV